MREFTTSSLRTPKERALLVARNAGRLIVGVKVLFSVVVNWHLVELAPDSDKKALRKQRHTAQRIFQQFRDKYGYRGGLTVVKDAVRAWRRTRSEVFVPLAHHPGETQVDFGPAEVTLDGRTATVAMFMMTLPYSD